MLGKDIIKQITDENGFDKEYDIEALLQKEKEDEYEIPDEVTWDTIEDYFAEVWSGVKFNIESKEADIEFWTDTAGQDIYQSIEYDGTLKDFLDKFIDCFEGYDVDEEVELYVNMRGQNGVPDSVRKLMDDCQEAKDTLMEMAETFKKFKSNVDKDYTDTYRNYCKNFDAPDR